MTDGTGSFNVDYVPRRILRLEGVATDCADADACQLVAETFDGSLGASAPIRFDPSIPPPPPPSITVTPSTDLLDGQTVTIEGSDFDPNSSYGVVQCVEPPSVTGSNCDLSNLGSANTDNFGSFITTLTVSRLLYVGDTVVDCADPGACVLGVGSGDPSDGDSAPIQFDPMPPLPPPALLTVTPDTGLVDGQFVQVHGTGYRRNSSIGIVQCRPDPGANGAGRDLSNLTFLQVGSDGTFTTSIRVHRFLNVDVGIVDCAVPEACIIGAGPSGGGPPGDEAFILFAGDPGPTSTSTTSVPPPSGEVQAATATATTPTFTG